MHFSLACFQLIKDKPHGEAQKTAVRIQVVGVLDIMGEWQFACTPGMGAQGCLLVIVLSWIRSFEQQHVVALCCSDVSEAFDRVSSELLCRGLESSGVLVVDLFRTWLADGVADVLVNGAVSRIAALNNSVFQAPTLGRPLWNLHFAAVSDAVGKFGFTLSSVPVP